MARNYPGPYEVEINYRVSNMLHVMRLSCIVQGTPNVGDIPSSISLLTRSGQPRSLVACVDDFWAFMRQAFNTTTVAEGYTLWRYYPSSFQRDYVTAGTIANPAGTRTIPTQLASQAVITLRSAAGGILKVNVLEHVELSQQRHPYSASSNDWFQRVAQFLVSQNGWAVARDNGFPVVGLRTSFGQNEAIWRKRYRI